MSGAETVYRYQFDKTGNSPANLIVSEPHTITPGMPIIVANEGLFYADTLVVEKSGTQLTESSDYKFVSLDKYATALTGLSAVAAIEMDGSHSGTVNLTYQCVGGPEGHPMSLVRDLLDAIALVSSGSVTWSQVLPTAPAAFPPSLHSHYPSDLSDLDMLASLLRELTEALSGDRVLRNTGNDLSEKYERLLRVLSQQRNSINTITSGIGSGEAINLIQQQLLDFESTPDVINPMLIGITEIIQEWETSEVKTVRAIVSFTSDDGNVHTTDLLLGNDSTNAYMSTYGTLKPNGSLFDITTAIIGGKMQMNVLPKANGELKVKWLSIN